MLTIFSNLDGDVYFESVNCGANLGHMTFHAWVFRKIYGKLGMIVVAGAPKLAKTKVRLSCTSGCNDNSVSIKGNTFLYTPGVIHGLLFHRESKFSFCNKKPEAEFFLDNHTADAVDHGESVSGYSL